MNYYEAFEKFIKGKKAVKTHWKDSSEYFKSNIPYENQWYGLVTEFSNGYKTVHYGGGYMGEDVNNSKIINPEGNIIAQDQN